MVAPAEGVAVGDGGEVGPVVVAEPGAVSEPVAVGPELVVALEGSGVDGDGVDVVEPESDGVVVGRRPGDPGPVTARPTEVPDDDESDSG